MKFILKNKSITAKSFVIFFLLFLSFLVIWVIGQNLFFEKYYSFIESKRLKADVNEFAADYINLKDSPEIKKSIIEYSNKSDAYYVIMNENAKPIHMISYEMTIIPDDGSKEIIFNLDSIMYKNDFTDTEFKVGDNIEAEYLLWIIDNETKMFFPTKIIYKDKEWDMNNFFSEKIQNNKNDKYKFENIFVKGRISSVNLPLRRRSTFTMGENDVATVILNCIDKIYKEDSFELNETKNFYLDSDESDSRFDVVIKKIDKNEKIEYICAVMPIENIFEAAEILKDYTFFLFFMMFIFMLVNAKHFSKLITKPVIEMSSVATKMKSLDFSQKCEVHTNDELGMLAENINDMSEKLDSTIKELQEANEYLLRDIEREKRHEKYRKEFIASVSHELKTPLAIIRAYSEGLLDGVSKERKREYIDVIIEETKKMDKLVNHMLEISKLESGKIKPEIHLYDLTEFVKKQVDKFVVANEKNKSEIILRITSEHLMRYFDPDLIDKVIQNYLSNAKKNTTGKITIGLDSKEFWVENEGKQINDEEKERVWNSFYRIDNNKNKLVRGTGLGLTISRAILKLHKAKFGIENTAKGVKFWFSLREKEL